MGIKNKIKKYFPYQFRLFWVIGTYVKQVNNHANIINKF